MRYRAVNGSTPAVELTEAQAREDYERARTTPGHAVEGAFGKAFTTYFVGRNGVGRPLPVGETTYIPIHDE